MPTHLYRYQEMLFTNSKLSLVLHEFPIIKLTRFGVWINVYGRKRFVLTSARKKYANPTKEEALESFHARKRRQIRILKHNLARAEAALRLTTENQYEYCGLEL